MSVDNERQRHLPAGRKAQLAAYVADTGQVFAVGHSSRRLSGHREMKRWLEDGRIGDISLAEAEKSFLEETLRAVGYDSPRAAETLGIGLRTLYRKLKEYEIG